MSSSSTSTPRPGGLVPSLWGREPTSTTEESIPEGDELAQDDSEPVGADIGELAEDSEGAASSLQVSLRPPATIKCPPPPYTKTNHQTFANPACILSLSSLDHLLHTPTPTGARVSRQENRNARCSFRHRQANSGRQETTSDRAVCTSGQAEQGRRGRRAGGIVVSAQIGFCTVSLIFMVVVNGHVVSPLCEAASSERLVRLERSTGDFFTNVP